MVELGQTLGLATASLAARLALAALLAAAGAYKVRHPLIAAVAATNFRVVPRPWKGAGSLLGIAEVAVAVAMVLPSRQIAAAGSMAAGCLCVGYAAVVSRALLAGRRFPCNCLPGLVGDVSVATLCRALAMAAGAVLGAMGPLSGAAAADLPAAIGLAVSAIGLPLAVLGAAKAWRSYRTAIDEADWTWVLAAHAGQTFTPPPAPQEAAR